jgi:hypothetical protein
MGGHFHVVELQAHLVQPVLILQLMRHLQQAEQTAAQLWVWLIGHELKQGGLVVSSYCAHCAFVQAELGRQAQASGGAQADL